MHYEPKSIPIYHLLLLLTLLITFAAVTGICLECKHCAILLSISIPLLAYLSYKVISKFINKSKTINQAQ